MTATGSPSGPISDNLHGAVLMVGAMAAYTLNDTCMKALSSELPLFQAMLIRGIGVTMILTLAALALGQFSFRMSRRDAGLVAVRTLAEVAATYFFLTALFNMPLANVSAIMQALPLTVTLAGAVFLAERVGWRRMAAICIGFLGVMLIVRPGTEGFTVYSLYALTAVALVTLRELVTRKLSSAVPSATVAIATALGVALFAAIATVGSDAAWTPITPRAAWLLAGATLFLIGGYLLSVMVMRVGEIGFVAPFRYSGLLVALIAGFLVFGHWPDALTFLGMTIVIGTGIFTLFRERRVAGRSPGSGAA